MAKAGAGIGRPKKSSVWQYFEYNKLTKESTCTVETSESGSICGKKLKGFYPTNLKKHLRQLHPNEYKKFEQNERERISEDMEKQKHDRSTSSQISLSEVVVRQKPYDKESQRNKSITTKLAIFLGATNIPLSVVESQEFRDLMHEMDKCYTVPQRKKIGDEVEKVYVGLKERIHSTLERARRISICADIWSKPDMTASFLGVTAHYYTSDDTKRHSVCLALRRFPSPHSGERVSELLKTVIDEWQINRCKLFRVLTDNGSNVVAAFKKSISEMEKESQDVESEEELEDGVTQSQDQFDLSNSEVEIKEEEGVEIADFESCEIDHRIAFTGWKRLSCFVHTLQLVVKVFEINPCESTLKKARQTVQKINKSRRATERLLHLAGVELTKNCPKSTKWDSTLYMLSRLLEVKEHIIVVLDELAWDGFTHLQWKQLEDMKELLQPFAHFRNVSSSQKGTSIAMVVPVLKELNLHLEMFIDPNAQNSIISIARSLLEELGKRFAFVLDPEDVHFDGIYLAAVLLNPSYRKILNDVQISCAKKFLKDMIAQDSRNDASIGNEFNTPRTQDMQESEEKPPPKRFKHLSLVCRLLEKEENNTEVVTPSLSKEEEEIRKYIESTLSNEEKELDPLDFWIRVKKTYPLLYPIACDIMSTPASIAPVERIFLCSGEVTKSKRNRLTDSRLEREILLRKNTDYL